MEAHLTVIRPTTDSRLMRDVATALQRALVGDGKLDEAVLSVGGMSGRKYRLFINNLIGAMDDARYLEVGVWAGSTLCAAIDQNAVTALAIDNWSQFGGPAQTFYANLARFKHPGARVSFLESDFRDVDYGAIGRFNVYLFDGPHERSDQHSGIMVAQPALESEFVLIIDDWNWDRVRDGTLAAISDAKLSIAYMAEIRTTLDNSHAVVAGEKSDWHNGYFIGVLTKTEPVSPNAT